MKNKTTNNNKNAKCLNGLLKGEVKLQGRIGKG
jgi:hypothetical protein